MLPLLALDPDPVPVRTRVAAVARPFPAAGTYRRPARRWSGVGRHRGESLHPLGETEVETTGTAALPSVGTRDTDDIVVPVGVPVGAEVAVGVEEGGMAAGAAVRRCHRRRPVGAGVVGVRVAVGHPVGVGVDPRADRGRVQTRDRRGRDRPCDGGIRRGGDESVETVEACGRCFIAIKRNYRYTSFPSHNS